MSDFTRWQEFDLGGGLAALNKSWRCDICHGFFYTASTDKPEVCPCCAEEEEPRSEPSDRELAGRHTHDAIDEEDLL